MVRRRMKASNTLSVTCQRALGPSLNLASESSLQRVLRTGRSQVRVGPLPRADATHDDPVEHRKVRSTVYPPDISSVRGHLVAAGHVAESVVSLCHHFLCGLGVPDNAGDFSFVGAVDPGGD